MLIHVHFHYYIYLSNEVQMGRDLNGQHLDTGSFTSATECFLEVKLSHVHMSWTDYILTVREKRFT